MCKLVVLSMDAMVWEDVAYLLKKPHFSTLMAHMSGARKVTGIYPSITYPAHVSIITGCTPGTHGIYTNGEFKTTGGSTKWHYRSDGVKVGDIFAAAKQKGLTTAAVYWPVTGNNQNIDYLIDEYFFPDPAESIEDGFRKLGANDDAIRAVIENLSRFPKQVRGIKGIYDKTNTFDDFLTGCACSLLRNNKPDVVFIHNCILDTMRHRYGVFNDEVERGLDLVDEWIGEIIDSLKSAGTYDATNFVILSDHGQLDYSRRIRMNTLLRRGGFLKVSGNGELVSWDAFSQTNGMSATIFLKDTSRELHDRVYRYLEKCLRDGVYGFSKIYTRDEVHARYGMDGDFAFMIETDGCTAFADGYEEPISIFSDFNNYRYTSATHGYEPEKGPQPVFLCKGPGFKADTFVEGARLIDEAPTLAALFAGKLDDAEGRVLENLILLSENE